MYIYIIYISEAPYIFSIKIKDVNIDIGRELDRYIDRQIDRYIHKYVDRYRYS